MLDINFIIAHKKEVEQAIKHKNVDLDLKKLLKLNEKRLDILQDIEGLQQQRNEHAKKIKEAGGKPSGSMIAEGKKIKEKIAQKEPDLREVEEEYRSLMLRVPNVYSDDTPVGKDDSDNKELRTWGKIPKFKFKIKDHMALGESLNLVDTERGTKIAGFRGYVLKNDLVRLQWALFSYCLDTMHKKGFQLMIPPVMVREIALMGSGHFPASREEIYPIEEDRFLAGTSEPSLLAYRSDETVPAAELPLRYCAVTPCYRREVGSYGKDTKGLYRVHEFWKVEQVVVAESDMKTSMRLFEEMLAISEEIMQDLQLPYRVVAICTGDMGAGKYKMYDIETWMPSREAYGETHSCSHLTDWQARRLQLRYKDLSGKIAYAHTMNNTVIAAPRILIALLENYQQEDGSVLIPDVLQPYMGRQKKIERDDA